MSSQRGHRRSRGASNHEIAALLRDGLSLAEVSKITGVKVHTIKHRLNENGWASNGRPIGDLDQSTSRSLVCVRCGWVRTGNGKNVPDYLCPDCRTVTSDLGEYSKWTTQPYTRPVPPRSRGSVLRDDDVCGQPRGVSRHRRRGEPICDRCRRARAAHERERKRERRAANAAA